MAKTKPKTMAAKRKTITQPEVWWVEFQDEADREDMSLSAWAGYCMAAKLSRRSRAKLGKRPAAHRPQKR